MNVYLMSEDARGQANFYIESPVSYNRSSCISLRCDDVSEASAAYANLSSGGESKYPFAPQPWGAYYGEVIDKFGVTWMITQQ